MPRNAVNAVIRQPAAGNEVHPQDPVAAGIHNLWLLAQVQYDLKIRVPRGYWRGHLAKECEAAYAATMTELRRWFPKKLPAAVQDLYDRYINFRAVAECPKCRET